MILQASGASGVRDRAAVRGRGALRRGAGLGAAQARAGHRARRRGLQADRPRGRARRHRARSSTRAARAVANSPLVKAALHGGDPNWGRIAQAVGAALPDTAPLRARHLHRGRAGLRGGDGDPVTTSPALAEAVSRRRGRVRRRAAGRRRRGRGLLLRPLARVRDDQRGLHDVMQRRRHPARGAPVHPGVPRQDGRHQVRRRGDDRPGAARGLRARRRAAQVRRAEPDRRPRRRAGHHRLHEAARTCRSSSSAGCA